MAQLSTSRSAGQSARRPLALSLAHDTTWGLKVALRRAPGASGGNPEPTANRPHARGSRWEAFARGVLRHYGDICHLCNHGGARSVDHLIVVTERPDLEWDLANCRPAHGYPHSCPVCHLNCNQIRGGYSVDRAKRIIAERIAKNLPPKNRREPDPDAGRPW